MCKLKDYQGLFSLLLRACLLSCASFVWVAPSAAEPVSPAKPNPEVSENLIVSTHDGLVSVTATEAPLKDVIERIGQALSIEVQAQIGANEKVTAEFHDLTLDQAIKRLSENFAYTTDSDGTKLSKLFVYPKGTAAPAGQSVDEAGENPTGSPESSPEPFKFEFDPADYIQQGQ